MNLPPPRNAQSTSAEAVRASIILSAQNLAKHFALPKPLFGPAEFVYAVAGVSFEVMRGETLAIVGESGCGKSTLARLLLRLIEPSGGDVIYEGRSIGALPEQAMRPLRRDMQIIFQDPFSSLNPRMSVGDLITEPLWLAQGLKGQTRRQEARRLLATVGLRGDHADRFPHEFSGGQRQRIGIARALSSRPKLVIGDEPVSALDVSVQAQIINLLEDLKDQFALTLIVIAHDLAVIRHMSERVLVMYLGRIVESGRTEDLYAAPLHPYTRALMDSIPLPSVSARHQFERSNGPAGGVIEGDAPNPAKPPPGCRFHTRCPYVQAICREVEPVLTDAGNGRAVACHLWRELPAAPGLAARAQPQSPRLARRLELYAAARAAAGGSNSFTTLEGD